MWFVSFFSFWHISLSCLFVEYVIEIIERHRYSSKEQSYRLRKFLAGKPIQVVAQERTARDWHHKALTEAGHDGHQAPKAKRLFLSRRLRLVHCAKAPSNAVSRYSLGRRPRWNGKQCIDQGQQLLITR